MEIWKSIVGYEGLYEVSNLGRIRSLDRYVRHSKGGLKIVRGGIKKLPPPHPKTGYILISLYKNNRAWTISVHRLVAFAFQEICGEYFEGATVDHIDTIRHNNRADNLRWCTVAENHANPISLEREKRNIQKAIDAVRGKPAWNKGKKFPAWSGKNHVRSKQIKQIDTNGKVVKIWENTQFAAKHFGVRPTNICNCLKGRSKTSAGYKWEYV